MAWGRSLEWSSPARTRLADALGVLWVLGAAGAVMAPALAHGAYLGSFDWVARFGLSRDPTVVVHNRQAFDQITEFIPWTNLAWTQMHHGVLPLWNPDSVLGTPLAFNWQSGVFSLPALIGYLFPLHLAYTVQVMATLVIAGTGAYVLGRLLGMGVLGCAMAATVFELSGPFFGWLGWPISAVMSWTGWLFAAVVVVVRGRHRLGGVAFFAVVVAAAVYAGQPDMLVILGLSAAVFLAALLLARTPALGGTGPIRRPLGDVVAGAVAGAALGAPLLLPGAQLISGSLRSGKRLSPALPAGDLSRLVFQGFDGLPVAGSHWFGQNYYTKTVVYVGVVALGLVVVAVVGALALGLHRRPVAAFGVLAVVMGGIVYIPVVESALDGLPLFGEVLWRRATVPLAFALAVLAGLGADTLMHLRARRDAPRWLGGAFAAGAVVLALIWGFGRGHLPPDEASIRARSFLWPAASVVAGLVVVAAMALAGRRRPGGVSGDHHWRRVSRVAVVVLLAGETAFLVGAGAPLVSSSATYATPTPAERLLARTVGSAVVGFGTNACFSQQLGIVPDLNAAYGVAEFADYEPLIPKAYDSSWRDATGQASAPAVYAGVPFSVFCPAVTDAAVARRYGVSFVLEPLGAHVPAGLSFVRIVGDEELYRVPGAGAATVVPLAAGGGAPGLDAPGVPVPVLRRDRGSTWTLTTDTKGPAVVRLRLTDVPGWHAEVDGHPVAISPFAQVMMQVRVPAGRHTVTVRYGPTTFDLGLGLAALAAVGLVVATAWGSLRRRSRPVLSRW